MKTDIAIIWAGVSGIWVALIFERYWVKNYTIFEKWKFVGNSFNNWTKETEFISPSFVSEDFGIYDLNSVSFKTNDSPWRFLQKERFTWKEYQKYLENISIENSLNTSFEAKIINISKDNDTFFLETEKWENIEAKVVIYAGWEYWNPFIPNIEGKEFGIHNSKITSYNDLKKDKIIIIWWYESGIDTAYNSLKNGKKVILLEKENTLSFTNPDPSLSISLHSKKRLSEIKNNPNFEIITDFEVSKIQEKNGEYNIYSKKWKEIKSKWNIVFATGFDFSQGIMKNLFEFEDWRPKLTKNFDSTKTKWLFIIWPMVKLEWIVFCFIYKYKQLFPTIVFYAMQELKIDTSKIINEFQIFWQNKEIKWWWSRCC